MVLTDQGHLFYLLSLEHEDAVTDQLGEKTKKLKLFWMVLNDAIERSEFYECIFFYKIATVVKKFAAVKKVV